MKLLIFKISSDNEYGALSFKRSEQSLESIHNLMKYTKINSISSEEDDWIVSLETVIIGDQDQINKIINLLNMLTDDSWCGDYDSRKSVDWDYLLEE